MFKIEKIEALPGPGAYEQKFNKDKAPQFRQDKFIFLTICLVLDKDIRNR